MIRENWIVEAGGRFYGPFTTQQEAVQWAMNKVSLVSWRLHPLHTP